MKNLEVWYAHLDIEKVLEEYGSQFKPKAVKRTEKDARQGPHEGQHGGVLEADPRRRRAGADRRPVAADRADRPARRRARSARSCSSSLRELMRVYRETLEFDRRVLLEQFELTDFARKVVGVGSVGTRAWIALLLGRDGQDPLFLQMKEAEASVLEEFLGPSEFSNHGQRVVAGQRLMQATSDIFLGWLHVEGRAGRQAARLLRPAAQGLEGLGGDRADGPEGHGARTAGSAAGRWPARTPAAATASRSPPTSATATASTARSSSSPRPTPSRTSATTRRCSAAVEVRQDRCRDGTLTSVPRLRSR